MACSGVCSYTSVDEVASLGTNYALQTIARVLDNARRAIVENMRDLIKSNIKEMDENGKQMLERKTEQRLQAAMQQIQAIEKRVLMQGGPGANKILASIEALKSEIQKLGNSAQDLIQGSPVAEFSIESSLQRIEEETRSIKSEEDLR